MHIERQEYESHSDVATINSFIASRVCKVEYRPVNDALPLQTKVDGITLGSVGMFKHSGRGARRTVRQMEHIRADHVDDFMISLPINGQIELSQSGQQQRIAPGYFSILATSKPFSISPVSGTLNSSFARYAAIVPAPLLRARVPRIDECGANLIKITPGAGTIMAALFELAVRDGRSLSNSQAQSFGGMLVDAIVNSVREAPELAFFCLKPGHSSYARLRERVEYFITCNISNPSLNLEMVAEHCKVSKRYLNEAFAAASTTLGSHIRNTRLDRCREALLSQELIERSIFEIALRWGFTDPAYFSRAYKARFGKAPRADRKSQ